MLSGGLTITTGADYLRSLALLGVPALRREALPLRAFEKAAFVVAFLLGRVFAGADGGLLRLCIAHARRAGEAFAVRALRLAHDPGRRIRRLRVRLCAGGHRQAENRGRQNGHPRKHFH